MATQLVFSKVEQKQIALRFKTLYSVVTAKTWTTCHEGIQNPDTADEKVFVCGELRKMNKGHGVPKGLKMCLIGAAAFVNGPTEEQILALIATQIVMDKHMTSDGWDEGFRNCMLNYIGEKPEYSSLDNSTASHSLIVFEQFALAPDGNTRTSMFSYMSGYTRYNAVDEIVDYNDDDPGIKKVRGMLKRAQGLYDKLYKVWLMEQEISKVRSKYEKALSRIKF